MSYLHRFKIKLTKILTNKFIQNLGWLSGSRFIIKVVRLLTTIVLARFLTKYDYGLAAIVLTTYELTQVFTRIGIGSKLIQAEQKDLEELCNSAYWLNWVIFIALFFGQCLVAFPIALFYQDNNLILPICVLSLGYLINPISAIQGILIRRENRLKVTALATGVCTSTGNVLSLIFAYLGMGLWAIVVPRVLVAPLWVYIFYTNHPWRPHQKFTTNKWGEIFNFGKNVLGVELLYTIRNNLDYLLIGRFLSIQELGIYYFAFNAGLGTSLGIIEAIKAALLPYLCSVRADWVKLRQQYYKSLKAIGAVIIPLVLLQSSLAPFYVPIVFGEKWIEAIPILMIICLSAIPRPFGDAASELLVAIGKPDLNFKWGILFTGIFIVSLFVGVQWQSIGVAIAVLLVHFTLLPAFTVWATHYVFKKS